MIHYWFTVKVLQLNFKALLLAMKPQKRDSIRLILKGDLSKSGNYVSVEQIRVELILLNYGIPYIIIPIRTPFL